MSAELTVKLRNLFLCPPLLSLSPGSNPLIHFFSFEHILLVAIYIISFFFNWLYLFLNDICDAS